MHYVISTKLALMEELLLLVLSPTGDAERLGMHSHAERRNDDALELMLT